MYTEKTLRGLSRTICALMLVFAILCVVMAFTGGGDVVPRVAALAASGESDAYSDSSSEVETTTTAVLTETTTKPQAHAWVMQVSGVPTYYNWEIQNDGIANDRNFGKNLWSESLTAEEAFKLFMTHMSSDPRACAATALGLSKELGFAVMNDEQSILDETERVNSAAAHYAADHDYWQADFNTMMNAVYGLKHDIEDIGEYSSACYMIFNGYDKAPTVIVSPSIRTGGHALVFYKQDGGKIRFRLECSFQLVDVLVTSEDKPEPDTPETTTAPAETTTITTTTTVATVTSVETTQSTTESTSVSTSGFTTQPTTTTGTKSTTQPTTTSTTPSTTVSTSESTTSATESTTSLTEPTTTSTTESTSVSTSESTTTATTVETTQSTTESTSVSTSESTTQPTTTSTTPSTTVSTSESTTSVTESTTSTTESTTTTTSETTTTQTTTETTTTEPTTTTTLESKDPEQAPDATDDPDIGGNTDSDDTDTDATPEPDLPGTPTTDAGQTDSQETSTSYNASSVAMLPKKNGVAMIQQILSEN